MTAIVSWLASLLTTPFASTKRWMPTRQAVGRSRNTALPRWSLAMMPIASPPILHRENCTAARDRGAYEPDKLMGYAVTVYIGKLLICDKCWR